MVSRMKLTDPYLRAVFAFLTSDSENYDLVVVSYMLITQLSITMFDQYRNSFYFFFPKKILV